MELYKQAILTIEDFTAERPDLAIHTDNSIQSAIYQSASILNAECNGLIEEVYNYMSQPEEDIDPKNRLYRTPAELGFIKTAFIMQTQFTLNNGNEFVQGSMNYNASGFNYSQNSPIERDTLAPNVLKMLAKARVYNFNYWESSNTTNSNKKQDCEVLPPEKIPMTISQADLRYVQMQNPNSFPGQLLIVTTENNSRKVVYKYPQDIFSDTSLMINAQKVLDKDNNFRELKNTLVINELGTYAQNINSTLGQELVNQLRRIETIEDRIESGIIFKYRGDWEPNRTYELLDVVRYRDGRLYWVKVPTTDTEPTQSTDWGDLSPVPVDLSAYATIDWVNEQLATKLTEAQANGKYVSLTTNQTVNGNKIFVGDNLKFRMRGTTGWIEVDRSNGTRMGLVGKASSSDNKFYIWSDSDNVVLRAPADKNIEIDPNNNVHSAKAPSNAAHLTNKSYVDNADTELRNAINDIRDHVSTVTNYSPDTTYKLGDTVYLESNQEFYISMQDNNIGHDPETSPDYWKWLTNSVGGGGNVDLTEYLKKTEAERIYATNTKLTNEYYTQTESNARYLTRDSLNEYATQQWVLDKNYAPNSALASYVTTTFLNDNYDTSRIADTKYVKLNLPAGQSQRINAQTYFDKSVTVKFMGTTGWLEFQNVSNARMGLIGKASSSTNKLYVWADDELVLYSGRTRNVAIDDTNNVWSSKAPTAPQHLTNKDYVDNKWRNVPTPTAPNDPVNKAYADNLLKNVPTPTTGTSAVNKNYVDNLAAPEFKTVVAHCRFENVPVQNGNEIQQFRINCIPGDADNNFVLPEDVKLKSQATLLSYQFCNFEIRNNSNHELIFSEKIKSNVELINYNIPAPNLNSSSNNRYMFYVSVPHFENQSGNTFTNVTLSFDITLNFIKKQVPMESINVTDYYPIGRRRKKGK